jgi:hypothetical protein
MNTTMTTAGLRPWRERLATAIRGEAIDGVRVRPAGPVTGYTLSISYPIGAPAGPDLVFGALGHVNERPYCGAAAGTLLLDGVGVDEDGPFVAFAHREDRPWNHQLRPETGEWAEVRGADGQTPYLKADFDRLP